MLGHGSYFNTLTDKTLVKKYFCILLHVCLSLDNDEEQMDKKGEISIFNPDAKLYIIFAPIPLLRWLAFLTKQF